MIVTFIIVVVASVAMIALHMKASAILGGTRDIRAKDNGLERIIRSAIEILSPIGNPEANIATIFEFGRATPRQDGETVVFRATTGWRYGFVALMPFIVAFAIHLELNTGLSGQTPVGMYLLLVGFLVWGGTYMWVFRLCVEGTEMVCTTPLLSQKHFDLIDLVGADYNRDGYKLHFSDGRSISIPRFLEGHDLLKAFLIAQLEENGY